MCSSDLNFAGRLLELLRQMERHRQRQLAEIRLLGLLNDNRHIQCVSRRDVLLKNFLDSLFEEMKHQNPSIPAAFTGPGLPAGKIAIYF